MIDATATTPPKVKKPGFPKLMIAIHDQFIVLFISESTGTLVQGSTRTASLGCQHDAWNPASFEDYLGVVKLKNCEELA